MVRTREISLFDMPIEDIEFEHLEQFFGSKFPESEKIDYKEARPDTGRPDAVRVASTIGAMSNTEGGIVFLGVAENEREKTPASWPGVSIGDPIWWVGNVCHAHITPVVFPEVKPCRNEKTDGDVVFIRVPLGQNQPYFVKDKGVLVRIGDQNRLADLVTLERMFRRRIEPTAQLERLQVLLDEKSSIEDLPDRTSLLTVIVGSKLDELHIRMGTDLDKMLFRTVQQISMEFPRRQVSEIKQKPTSKESKVIFGSRAKDCADHLSLDNKGALIYTSYLPWGGPDETNRVWVLMVELWELAKEIYRILDLAERLYIFACDYRGPIFVGASLNNIRKVALSSVSSQLRMGTPEVAGWTDQSELSYEHDKTEVIRDFLQSLLRELQYKLAERIADSVIEQMELTFKTRSGRLGNMG